MGTKALQILMFQHTQCREVIGIINYPGFGMVLTISSGMFSSSQGVMPLSFSRQVIFMTTFFKSSMVAEARGSIILMTQLHNDVNLAEYLDTSVADISVSKSNMPEKLKFVVYNTSLDFTKEKRTLTR